MSMDELRRRLAQVNEESSVRSVDDYKKQIEETRRALRSSRGAWAMQADRLIASIPV